MTDAERRYTDEVPEDIESKLREICDALPETHEQQAWVGTRWLIRKRTFAFVFGMQDGDDPPLVVLSFRSTGQELEVLRNAGPPFFLLGWGRDALGMVLDDGTAHLLALEGGRWHLEATYD